MESKTLPSLLHTNKTHVGAVEMSPWMYPYMLGYRDKVPFFNVEETLIGTQKALVFLKSIREKKGEILIVNTHPAFSKVVKKTSTILGIHYVNEHWIGGLLTNWQQLKYSVHAYKKFNSFISPIITKDIVAFPKYTKAKKRFDGIQNMVFKPDAILLLQATTAHKSIIEEAKRLKIPVIACVDSSSPTVSVEYPIPINTYSKAFCHFLCRLLVKIC